MLVGVVNCRPEHGVKRRLGSSGGRPREETGRDALPSAYTGSQKDFPGRKTHANQRVKRVCHLEFGVIYIYMVLYLFYIFFAKKLGFVLILVMNQVISQ